MRSSSRMGNQQFQPQGAPNSSSGLNRNSASFSTNPLLNQQQQQAQHQQQQFMRSNSWNLNPHAQQMGGPGGVQDGRNFSQVPTINNGYYILIKNVTHQVRLIDNGLKVVFSFNFFLM